MAELDKRPGMAALDPFSAVLVTCLMAVIKCLTQSTLWMERFIWLTVSVDTVHHGEKGTAAAVGCRRLHCIYI